MQLRGCTAENHIRQARRGYYRTKAGLHQHTELLGLAVSLENPEGCQSCCNFPIDRKLLAPVHSSMCNHLPQNRVGPGLRVANRVTWETGMAP